MTINAVKTSRYYNSQHAGMRERALEIEKGNSERAEFVQADPDRVRKAQNAFYQIKCRTKLKHVVFIPTEQGYALVRHD